MEGAVRRRAAGKNRGVAGGFRNAVAAGWNPAGRRRRRAQLRPDAQFRGSGQHSFFRSHHRRRLLALCAAIYETPGETDIINVIQMLTRFGHGGGADSQSPADAPADFQRQVSELSHAGQQALQQALLHIAEHQGAQPDTPLLVQLAEDLAIKFALDRYQRGEVRVNAVREMMERMSREMESLRSVLNAHEEKMARAGMMVESRADILDRQFWAAMPEQGKRSVLLSSDAW